MTSACAAIVPSRGRPGQVDELLEMFGDTAVCSEMIICLDDDDPALGGYRNLARQPKFARHPVTWHVGPRKGLTAWTNDVAGQVAGRVEALITLGDDHRPETPAWDRKLLDAARGMGGGWAYGHDGAEHQETPPGWVTSVLPTAFLVTSPIVTALGWMLLPSCQHMFVDAAARDLALAASEPDRPRLAWLPDVKVRHDHYTTGRSARDATYDGGYASWPADEAAYRAWLAGPIRNDAETVRRACHADV